MRFFPTLLALAIICTATAAVATDSVEARERTKINKTSWSELRYRLHTYQNYTKTTTAPQTETATNKTTSETKPQTTPTPAEATDQYLQEVKNEIHRLTNVERNRAGVANLAQDNALSAVAREHSEDMLKRDYFSHTSPEGCNMACRLADADYEYWAWGENIAWRKSSSLPDAKALAKHFVDSWMASSGHRKNILSANFTHEGIGLARDGGLVYVTASFADPR